MIAKADDEGFDHGTAADDLDPGVLTTAPEVALLRGLAAFPGVVDEAVGCGADPPLSVLLLLLLSLESPPEQPASAVPASSPIPARSTERLLRFIVMLQPESAAKPSSEGDGGIKR